MVMEMKEDGFMGSFADKFYFEDLMEKKKMKG